MGIESQASTFLATATTISNNSSKPVKNNDNKNKNGMHKTEVWLLLSKTKTAAGLERPQLLCWCLWRFAWPAILPSATTTTETTTIRQRSVPTALSAQANMSVTPRIIGQTTQQTALCGSHKQVISAIREREKKEARDQRQQRCDVQGI